MSRQPSGNTMPCAACAGRGFSTCTACGGARATFITKSRMRYDRTMEFYQDRVPCTGCFSSGRIPCLSCQGLGWVLQSATAPPSSSRRRAPVAPPPDAPVVDQQEFQFQVQNFVSHPNHREIWACWQHNPGNCLDIGLTLSTSMRVELSGQRTDVWLTIRDNAGRPVPLSIRISSRGGLFGKWL